MKSLLTKILTLVMVVALSVTAGVAGTMAYLQDDDSDVNVMTLGNVSITQHEYQRAVNEDGTYKTATIDDRTSYVLQDFTQAKPLLPIVGDPNEPGDSPAYAGWDDTTVRMSQVDSYGGMQVFAGKNAQDKFVTVENSGVTDAYVRTLVAVEIGSTDGSLISWSDRAQTSDSAGTAPWTIYEVGTIKIDDNNYMVVEYVYRGASDVNRHLNGILPAGETTYPNLCQVYLKHSATNEDMVTIDGNGNGTLDILVLSQAVQAAGFENAKTALDTAFGTSSEKAAEWFGGVSIPTAISSVAALKEGGLVVLSEDIELGNEYVTVSEDTTIDLNGNALTADRGASSVTTKESYAVLYIDGADVTLSGDGDVVNTAEDGAYCVYVDNGATVTITGGNYITYHDAVYVRDGKLIITGGFFQAKGDTKATADYIHPDYPDEPASFTAEVINCSKDAYINFKEGTDYSNGITAEVVITGGTFVNEDPSNIFEGWYTNQSYVPEGYKVVSEPQENGDIWYTVVAE